MLVIIGLLLGGILKGQEMITQAKIKNVIADFSGVSAAFYGYQDRYRAMPGDDDKARQPLDRTPTGAATATAWSRASTSTRAPPTESMHVLGPPAPRGIRLRHRRDEPVQRGRRA